MIIIADWLSKLLSSKWIFFMSIKSCTNKHKLRFELSQFFRYQWHNHEDSQLTN